jgi:hypothetical protein
VAALGGLTMAGIRFAGKPQPPVWLAMLHGFLSAAAVTLLLYAYATVGLPARVWCERLAGGTKAMKLSLFAIALLAACGAFAQTGTAMKVGNTTYYDVGGVTGAATKYGNTTYYNQSNGVNGTSQTYGNTTYTNYSNGLSATSTRLGGTTYYNFNRR